MGKGSFLNQKLGKRTTRRIALLKSGFKAQQSQTPHPKRASGPSAPRAKNT
jgi:hypothetical protein